MITAATTSAALAFVLGLRHALDADHLAAVDGLTRWNASADRTFAPFCGALFACGHCVVIVIASILLAYMHGHWQAPDWLATTGVLLSAGMLICLSLVNLRSSSLMKASMHARSAPGAYARLLGASIRAGRGWQVVLVGACFALSFDAVGLALLFSTSHDAAASSTPFYAAAVLALAFSAGMTLVSAANGWWVMRLLRHSHLTGARASRIMSTTIGVAGLAVGVWTLLPFFSPGIDAWLEANDLVPTVAVFAALVVGYGAALVVDRRTRLAARSPDVAH